MQDCSLPPPPPPIDEDAARAALFSHAPPPPLDADAARNALFSVSDAFGGGHATTSGVADYDDDAEEETADEETADEGEDEAEDETDSDLDAPSKEFDEDEAKPWEPKVTAGASDDYEDEEREEVTVAATGRG